MSISGFFSNIISPSYQPNYSTNKSTPTANNPIENNQSGSANMDAVRLSLSPEAKKYLQSLAEGKKTSENVPNKNTITVDNNEKNTKSAQIKSQTTQQSNDKSNLSQEELRTIRQLEVRDLHVKMHEQQHMAAAGAYAVGGPTYQFQIGPDGKSYAVGGEVKLDTSPIPNNPEATITKAQIIRQGALAPADPSGADRAVAAAASQMEAQARQELAEKNRQDNSINNQTTKQPNDKQNDSKIQAYKNFMQPKQIGGFINISA